MSVCRAVMVLSKKIVFGRCDWRPDAGAPKKRALRGECRLVLQRASAADSGGCSDLALKCMWPTILLIKKSVREMAKAGGALNNVPSSKSGSNVLRELRMLWSLVRLVARLRADELNLSTAKPALFGSFAGWLCRTQATIKALSELGNVLTAARLGAAIRRSVIAGLYAITFDREHSIVVLRNDVDLRQLSRAGAVSADRAIVVTDIRREPCRGHSGEWGAGSISSTTVSTARRASI
jgi:hypothetical protein